MKYFEVIAKCGHVGHNRYYKGHFFVKAFNASNAAQNVKGYPRVKRDHEDAILAVTEIEKDTYFLGKESVKNEAYFNCTSPHQQKELWNEIKDNVFEETVMQLEYRETKRYNRKENSSRHNKNLIRNPYKYAKYHFEDAIDYSEYLMA